MYKEYKYKGQKLSIRTKVNYVIRAVFFVYTVYVVKQIPRPFYKNNKGDSIWTSMDILYLAKKFIEKLLALIKFLWKLVH